MKYQAVKLGLNHGFEAKADEDRIAIIEKHGNPGKEWDGKVIVLNWDEAASLAFFIEANLDSMTRQRGAWEAEQEAMQRAVARLP